jgi:hypothetical protein
VAGNGGPLRCVQSHLWSSLRTLNMWERTECFFNSTHVCTLFLLMTLKTRHAFWDTLYLHSTEEGRGLSAYRGVKRPVLEADLSPRPRPKDNNSVLYLHTPHESSWLGIFLIKHRDRSFHLPSSFNISNRLHTSRR